MLHELRSMGLLVEPQKEILVPYKDILIEGQRLDLLVGGRVLVELKAVDKLIPIHEAQLLSYLKSTKLRLGLLINFNVPVLKDGIKRLVAQSRALLLCALCALCGFFLSHPRARRSCSLPRNSWLSLPTW
jgi:GxxExxY protein